jgi:hypothetical protein
MNDQSSRVTAIGHIAREVLDRNRNARVMGTSIHGIYLQPEGDLTLFLSRDHFRGPLTLNLGEGTHHFHLVQSGNQVLLWDHILEFPDPGLNIVLQRPLCWEPKQSPKYSGVTANRVSELVNTARSLKPEHPYLALLDAVSPGPCDPAGDAAQILEQVNYIYHAVEKENPAYLLSEARWILGAGPGLTPLGDDLLMGILLVINRVNRYQDPKSSLARLNQSILDEAQTKTTTLSWSLLSCAARGSADERIIRVLDGLVSGRSIADQDIMGLLEWGSSSGIAVLAGMILALS